MIITVMCGMSDDKVRATLTPLVEINDIERIYLVRRRPMQMAKVICYHAPVWIQWSLLLSEVFRVVCLFWICLTKRPNVLYAIYFVPHGIYAAIAGFIFRKRVIQELIGTDRLKVMRSKIYLWLLASAERIGVRGSRSVKHLAEIGIPEAKLFTPIAVNILDYQHFIPNDLPKLYDFIYCGRMDENKQVNILLSALAICLQSKPNIRAIFVGDGPSRAELDRMVSALGIDSAITFVGNQPSEAIPDFLNQSRIFMMASAFEGLPVAMLEALSCGVPVVVPKVGDICDIAEDGKNALVVDTTDPSQYAKAFEKLLNNQEFYYALVNGALDTRAMLIREFSHQNARKIWEGILLNGQ